jgi:diaminohydroxyphosphoribosylaminopyrimidine deaminase/5-amino-6-(5-phosphoribosylamino)uracil reductase
MVGVGTVLADDPLLTCRMEGGRNPIRIVCDSKLRTPLSSQLVQTAGEVETILATCCRDEARYAPYEQKGCTVLPVKAQAGQVDLNDLMAQLGARKIDSILLEGGGTLNWSALENRIVNAVQAYLAPKLFGGKDAKSPVEGSGVALPAEAALLTNTTVTKLGEDFLLEGEVSSHVHRNC